MSQLLLLCISIPLMFFGISAQAEFLEMPEVKQVEELRNKSLLRDMDIPAVKFRSPDPSEGPRLAVREFRIQGLVEYPKLGITRESLKKLSERIRFDLMGEGKLLDSGYTIEEINEVSGLLGTIEEETVGRHVEPVDVQRLVWLIREIREKRGITLGQIETVANTITQFYRERGFVLAKAYIPKQEVREGIVNLTVLLGMLGEVKISGNNLYKTPTLSSVFDDMLGKPVTSTATEEKLFLINDYPGVFVDGHFEPGFQVGDTRLSINVKDESRFSSNVRVDNHGSDESGLYRLYADAQFNNLFGLADKLQASALYAFSPSNTTFWQLQYQMKLFGPRTRLSLDFSKNQFVVDQSSEFGGDIVIESGVTVSGATFTYTHQRNRTANQYYDLRYEQIQSDVLIADAGQELNDKIANLALSYRFDSLQEEQKRFHQGSIKFTLGQYVYGADEGQDENFKIYSFTYSLLDFWKLPLVNAETKLVYRLEGQYAGTNLSGISRFSLAGPTRARAFAPSVFTADNAVYFGVDWIFNSPDWMNINVGKKVNLKELMKPFLFLDYAFGRQEKLDTAEGDATARLMDIGLGFKLTHGKSFSGNILFGYPIRESYEGVQTAPDESSGRLIFDFQYSF